MRVFVCALYWCCCSGRRRFCSHLTSESEHTSKQSVARNKIDEFYCITSIAIRKCRIQGKKRREKKKRNSQLCCTWFFYLIHLDHFLFLFFLRSVRLLLLLVEYLHRILFASNKLMIVHLLLVSFLNTHRSALVIISHLHSTKTTHRNFFFFNFLESYLDSLGIFQFNFFQQQKNYENQHFQMDSFRSLIFAIFYSSFFFYFYHLPPTKLAPFFHVVLKSGHRFQH